MHTQKLLFISGSLRTGSYNTALLQAFASEVGSDTEIVWAAIGTLPLFNEDLVSDHFPESAALLKRQVREVDGILIATPEYNRTIPGVLKNAIDWTSQPTGDNAWEGKPVYVVGASSGTLGTVNAQMDLRKSLAYLRARVLAQPEFYLTFNESKFDAAGTLTDEKTKEYVHKTFAAFRTHVAESATLSA